MPSLSLVSSCVPFLFTGTLKVRGSIFTRFEYRIQKIHGDSLEHGHLPVHDLDRCWMLDAMHQFDRVEREHHQQGSGLL